MKKLLLGTTALVAAGMFASGDAAAQSKAGPIQAGVNGTFNGVYAFVSQDDGTNTAATPMGQRRSHGLLREAEARFWGQTRLDNGLLVGYRVSLEAEDCQDQIDESWIFFDSAYGRMEIGETDQVGWKMYYGAPNAIPNFSTSVHNIVAWNSNGTAAGILSPIARLSLGNDQNHINYFTPRFFGFQVGVSYTPEGCKEGNTDGDGAGTFLCGGAYRGMTPEGVSASATGAGNVQDIWEIAANYVNKFGDVGVAVYGAMNKGDHQTAGTYDPRQWGLGAEVSYMGFTLGGAYTQTKMACATVTRGCDNPHWNVGLKYATGPWGVGIEYAQAKQEFSTGAADDEGQFLYIGGTYLLGPGINLFAGVQFFELDAGTPATSTKQDNDGTVFLIGTAIAF